MKKWKVVLLLFTFSLLSHQVYSQSYKFLNYTTEDGLAQSYIYSILQDVHGYLWIGSGNGLSKYDGFKFVNYTINDSLADNFVTCGIRDEEYLWFGHMNGKLSYFKDEKFQTLNLLKKDLSPVTHFAKSSNGDLWVSTYADGLFKLGKEGSMEKHLLFKDFTIIISFEFLDDGDFLVGTNSGVLYCRLNESNEIEVIRSVSEIPESKITCIQKMRNKPGYYISTENDGLFQLYKEDNLFKVSKILSNTPFDFEGIQDLHEDLQSNLWLATKSNGLIKISYSPKDNFSEYSFFNTTNDFVSDYIKTVFVDREGNIWSGSYGDGLTQITTKAFSVNTFDRQIYGNDILSISLNRKYHWIGTENGLIKMEKLTNKIVNFYSSGKGLPKDKITALYSATGNELWIGTEENGVFFLNPESQMIYKYPIGNGDLENSVNFISGKGENIWIGTKKGLCNINSVTNKIKWYSIKEGGLPHNYINGLFIDKSDRVWVTTRSNVLSYIMDEKVFKIPLISTNGILTLGPIIEDKESRLWIGSYGNGVFLMNQESKSDSVMALSVKEGLLSNYCYSLLCDDYNNIWVGHKGGLSRINAADFSIKPIQQIEDINDSYQFNPNAMAKGKKGKIWFGSSDGLVLYDPSMENPQLFPPVLGITSVKINDEEIAYSDKIVLSPGNYKIKIDFLGVSLREPELVSYQYKLEGYDQWSEITKIKSKTYHLSEGNYTFILKATSGDGMVTKDPLTINIIIKKPLWKKWWFYPLIVILLIILSFFYFKRREYVFEAEKKILEEKVQQRTSEIESQKNEIELQRDLIKEKNNDITSSIKYGKNIQNAVFPSLQLIDKLLPDNFILYKPKDIVSGDFYWLSEKDDKIIFTVSDCTGHGVPGAFMSLLGITFLNEIVNIQGITQSDEIVNKLREKVIESLKQKRQDISTADGMDMALCVIDRHKKTIQFTGAKRNYVYIRDGKLEVIKGDYLSVSILSSNDGVFSKKEIDFMEGDIFYLFSDGYQDQFGGEFDKKYLISQLYRSFLEIHKLPMADQKQILEVRLKEWMKDTIQTDDITVAGIRL
jgi:ligand-binding sensor domain-containing protein/serine phosphatase RsbU (regulator of sigma subunit)